MYELLITVMIYLNCKIKKLFFVAIHFYGKNHFFAETSYYFVIFKNKQPLHTDFLRYICVLQTKMSISV